MIADGVLRDVQIKRNDPVDILLQQYYSAQINADIISIYAGVMPPCKDAIKMATDIVEAKYPHLGNKEQQAMDQLDKYNRAMAMAGKITRKPKKRK